MIIKNVKVYTEDKRFEDGEIYIWDGIFTSAPEGMEAEEMIDGEGAMLFRD